ncbi:hypothetical protein F7C95_04550 [Opitutia bacterium ISCC 51]|nr:hypothetical protein F7C95_04550 [Opitutae bacterium ISCC 51]QXD29247.1 hypothetical protein GA003_04530 [Opitutae bacterium ISCC 52]
MRRHRSLGIFESPVFYWATLFVFISTFSASADPSEQVAPAENYLFTGLDMYWVEGGQKYRVQDFSKKRVQIVKDGELVSVRKGGSLIYASRSKVSQQSLQLRIDKISTEYSKYQADYEALQSTFSLLAVESDSFDQNASSFFESGDRYSIVMNGETVLSGASVEAMERTQSNIENFENVRTDLEDKMNNAASLADMVRIQGELRLPAGIHEGFMMLLVRYTSAGNSSVKLQPVHRSFKHDGGDSPFAFNYAISGFPAGFHVEDVGIHVFSNGKEIPHQESNGLRGMSDLDYFEYLLSKYKKSSGREEPVLFRPLDADAIVEVAPSRNLGSIKIEMVVQPDGSTRVDYLNVGYIEDQQPLVALLEEARFFPAMENGALIESTLFVPLSSLVQ